MLTGGGVAHNSGGLAHNSVGLAHNSVDCITNKPALAKTLPKLSACSTYKIFSKLSASVFPRPTV
jgi:hypothetical protein